MLNTEVRIRLNLLQEELPQIMDSILYNYTLIQNFKQNRKYVYTLEDGSVTSIPANYENIIKLMQNDIGEFIYYIIHYSLETNPDDCLLAMFTYHFEENNWQKLTAYPLLIINNKLVKVGNSWDDPEAIAYPSRHPSLDIDCSC